LSLPTPPDAISTDMLQDTLRHLESLVSFGTRHPPRNAGGIFDYIRAQLPGFRIDVADHGDGAISLLAVRGKPTRLFSVHLGTVPASGPWTSDPLRLRLTDGHAVGLGACGIKGAAAGLLAAAGATRGDAALLVTNEVETSDARGVAAFLGSGHAFHEVVVAAPTRCEAVLAHRGISSVTLRFKGDTAHGKDPDASGASAVHQAMRWGDRALAFARSESHRRFGGLTGLRFNIGRIEGGSTTHEAAADAEVNFGFRALPSQDIDALHARFASFAGPGELGRYAETFRGPPLPAGDIASAEEHRLAARDLADELGLPVGNAVDFWTEASLFSRAGMTALVFGPGDIAQARIADESVALEQLATATGHYMRLLA
jgi:acetylornithine deacetylase